LSGGSVLGRAGQDAAKQGAGNEHEF